MTQTGRLYGGSLYDLAAQEQLTETIHQQMKDVLTLFRENPDYIRLLSDPALPKTERIGLIDQAFKGEAEPYLVNFLKLLCERGILGEYAECCKEYTRRYYADNGIAEAVVTSAVDLTEEQLAQLKEKLEKISGKKILLITKTDPAVVAGLSVEMEGVQYDGTVKGRLSGLSRKLNEIIV